jgi:hypothetical protein
VVLVVSADHENQYNDRLKSTAKGLEIVHGLAESFSGRDQLPAQKLSSKQSRGLV